MYSNVDCNNNLSSATKILDKKLDQRHLLELITYNFPSFETTEGEKRFSRTLCAPGSQMSITWVQILVLFQELCSGLDKVLMTLRCDLALKAGIFGLSQFLLEYCNEVPGKEPALITMVHKIFTFTIRRCHTVGWVTTMFKPALWGRLARCLPRAEEVLSWGLDLSGGLSAFDLSQVCFCLWLGRDVALGSPVC